MAKQILRNTETIAAIKVWGAGSTETITLNTDLLLANRLVLDPAAAGVQKVNILSFTWSGAAGSSIKVVRGSTDIIAINCEQAGEIFFDDMQYNDNVANTSNFSITVTGDAYLWIVLRKAEGYKVTNEPGPYGVYDDPTILGPKA